MLHKIFTLLILAIGTVTFAQVDLEVMVLDYSYNKPVAGIEVKLVNESTGFHLARTTGVNGRVVFEGIPVTDKYVVSVDETEAYYASEVNDIKLQSNTNASVTINIGSKINIHLSEIVIRGSSNINIRNAEVSSVLKEKEIQSLPLEGRDITRLLYRLPNVVQATGFYPEAPNVSINGANSLFTNYLIDGMDNNEQFLGGMKFNVPVGFAHSVNVLTNNFSTEYGNTGNGIVNITSKSGGNEQTGEFFIVNRPGPALDGKSRYAQRDLSGNFVKDGFSRYQLGGSLGGAIIKNRTFYYINAEHTTDIKDNRLTSPALGVNTVVPGRNQFNYLNAKLDHRWSDRFSSSLRANVGIVSIERQGGGLDGGVTFPSAGGFQDRNSSLIALQNTYRGNAFKSETNVQYSTFRWNYNRAVHTNSAQVVVLDPSEQTIAILGHPGYIFDSHEKTIQAQQKITVYKGNHTIKTGVEILSSAHSLYGGGNIHGSYLVKLNESQLASLQGKSDLQPGDIPGDVTVLNYAVELKPASFGARQNIISLYAEDAIHISNSLTATLGLRYDYDNLSKGGGDKGDYNNLAPRLSLNYRLNSTSSIRAGYGMFYDKILYSVYSDALQQNTTSADYKLQLQELINKGILPADTDLSKITFDGNLVTNTVANYLQGPSYNELQSQRGHAFSNERRILNPNGYQNPLTHQISIGYQKQLNNQMLFYVDAVRNKSENLFRLRDLNAPTPFTYNGTVRTQAEADLTRPVAIVNNSAIINGQLVTGVARNVIMTETAGKSEYYGLSINLQKDRGSDPVAWRLIYTLSQLKNNTEDINFRAEDSNNFEREWAHSINDRTHVINGIITYFPVKNLSLTIAALIQSGQPINRIPDAGKYGTTDLNGDGRSFGDAYVGNSDREPGEGRNSDRLPWSNTFDLAAQYDIPRGGKKGNLSIRADVFNLFNAENLSGYSNNATQSNQIQAGTAASGLLVRRNAAPPRQFQFALRYSF